MSEKGSDGGVSSQSLYEHRFDNGAGRMLVLDLRAVVSRIREIVTLVTQ